MSQAAAFVNKVLLEHSQVSLFTATLSVIVAE